MAEMSQTQVRVVPPFNFVNQQAFQGIAASQPTTVNVAVGSTYYGMALSIPGATVAQIATAIARVQWNVDGETLLDLSGAECQTIFAAEGGTNRDGELILPIVPRYYRSAMDTLLSGVGLGRSAASFLQVTMGATITGVTTMALFTRSVPDNRPLGSHRRLIGVTQPVTGAGTWSLDLQRPGNAMLKNLHVSNGALVTAYSTRVNQNLIRNAIPTAMANGAFNAAGYLPVANVVSQTFDEIQAGVAGLPLVGCTDLNLATTVSGAPAGNSLRILQDYLWNVGSANF
jgi:hypothetical protein